MAADETMSAAQFADNRFDLPEGGRWHELHAGRPVLMEAPSDSYGNIVINLSRELARWLHSTAGTNRGYACHEVGLRVLTNPDTVYVPAISYFDSGPMFAQTDQIVATEVPRLVVEIAASNDRRRSIRERTERYLSLGVSIVWIPDPVSQEIQVLQGNRPPQRLGMTEWLDAGDVLPGFRTEVRQIFAQPDWWTSSGRRSSGEPQSDAGNDS